MGLVDMYQGLNGILASWTLRTRGQAFFLQLALWGVGIRFCALVVLYCEVRWPISPILRACKIEWGRFPDLQKAMVLMFGVSVWALYLHVMWADSS